MQNTIGLGPSSG